jgi:uncharacterized protein
MRGPTLALFVGLLVTPVSFAQQNSADAPASQEDIERYFEVMHSRDLMKSMLETMKKQVREMVHAQASKLPNLPPDFEEKENRLLDRMWQDFPVDEMLRATIPVYERHFTKGDIDGLVEFYSSPRGQKLLKELPSVTAESMQASQAIVQKMVAKELERVRDDISQAQKSTGGPN